MGQDEDARGFAACECEQCLGGRETLGLIQRAMTHLGCKDGVAEAAVRALHVLCLSHAPNVRQVSCCNAMPASRQRAPHPLLSCHPLSLVLASRACITVIG